MRFGRGVGLLAAAALAVSGLAACGDETEPTQPSTTASPIDRGTDSPSETSTGSETETASGPADSSEDVVELPSAAQEQTKAGAIAFNTFYWEEVGRAFTTGNPYVLETYAKECAVCDNLAQQIRTSESKGIRSNKNPYSVSNAAARKRSDSGYRVELTVNIASYHDILPDQSVGDSYAAQTITVVSDTQWVDGQWEIQDQVRTK